MSSTRSPGRPPGRALGLPPNPRARSASRPRTANDAEKPMYSSPAEPRPLSRQADNPPYHPSSLRSQRPPAGIAPRFHPSTPSSSRDPRPPLPSVASDMRRRVRSQRDDDRGVGWQERSRSNKDVVDLPTDRARSRLRARSVRSRASSPTSEASSVFDRYDDHSDSTSRTSLDSDGSDKSMPSNKTKPSWAGDDDDYKLNEDSKGHPAASSGLGAMLWTRVVDTAGALSMSVGQAWAAKTSADPDEATPIGGESHLTRVMKAYHLSKATSQAELPEWLFTEQERGVRTLGRLSQRTSERGDFYDDQSRTNSPSTHVPPRASLDSRALGREPTSASVRSEPDLNRAPTKAADRLRAIRDAKRGVTAQSEHTFSETASTYNDRTPGRRHEGYRENMYVMGEAQSKEVYSPKRAPVKVGLPSRPGPMRSF